MLFIKKIYPYFFMLLISVTVCFTFFFNPLIEAYYQLDSSVYQYIGRLITEGYVPYKDVFDHKGPIFYLWYALGYAIYPMTGQWILEVVCLFCGLSLIYQIARKYISNWIFFLLSFSILLAMPSLDTIGNTESLSFLFIFFLIFALYNFICQGKLSLLTAVLVGFSSGCLLLIKPTHLAMAVFFCLYVFVSFLYHKQYAKLANFSVYALVGGLVPVLGCVGWLWYHSALMDFWQDYFVFNVVYMNNFHFLQTYTSTIFYFFKVPLVWFAFAFMLVLILNRKRYSKAECHFLGMLIISTIFSFILVVIPRNPHAHYSAMLMPMTLVLGIFVFSILKKEVAFAFGLVLFMLFRGEYVLREVSLYMRKSLYEMSVIKETADFLKFYLKEGETFSSFYNDYDTLYLYSGHKAFNKYSYTHYADMFWHDKLVETFNDDLPRFVVTKIFPYHYSLVNLSLYHYIYINADMVVWEKNNP